ncbi:MAG: amino acid adenylation domain-containing protein [Psychrosphaera sp.]|nr:amino acid adenylation domain-containing protein [Psychrosphaera sp.]
MNHQQMPLEQLLDQLQPARDMNRPAVFQVLFNYQSDKQNQRELNLPGLSFTNIDEQTVESKFELSFNLMRRQSLELQIEYNTDLFEGDTIDQLFNDYQAILEVLVNAKQQPLSTLQLPSMQHSMMMGETQSINANDDFICRFEQQVRKTPHNTAVIVDDEHGYRAIDYAALNQAANQLAHGLIFKGVKPQQLVAFCLPRNHKMLIALLAIQKAGAAYLPLDQTHPQQRLSDITNHAQAVLCICEATTQDTVSHLDLPFYSFEQLTSTDDSNPRRSYDSEALAYTLYTSGSTGKPKGVEVERGNFAAFLQAIEQVAPPAKRLLALTTITFDIAALELCLPLVNGGAVVIANEQSQTDSRLLSMLIDRHKIDLIQATPATWRMLVDEANISLEQVHAICGGEALPQSLARQLQQQCLSLINVYGPTETTVWSSSYAFDAPVEHIVPIGKPLMHNRFYVLDQQQQSVPKGAIGELYIGGATVARGYRFDETLTQTLFITHPQFGRLYRTGDQVRLTSNGQLTFVGRCDFQIKRLGHRIEPGDIEARLLQYPAVKEAVVTVDNDNLVAWFVSSLFEGTVTLETSELNQYLSEHLPAYMLPNLYHQLAMMPLNSNGKVDRKSLPKTHFSPKTKLGLMNVAEQSVKTPRQQQLADIWQQLLNVEIVNANDNFFLLGGHSLLAAQLRSRLNKAGFNLPLKSLFEHPQLGEQAELMTQTRYANIPTVERQQNMPLSAAQNRLWFMQQIDVKDSSFNMQTSIRIDGMLQITALEKALGAVTQNNEILKVTYHELDGEAVQRFNPDLQVLLHFRDMRQSSQPIQNLLEATADEPFDLASQSPLRVYVYQTAAEQYYCQLVQHHIASDAWSMTLLLDQLMLAYQQIIDGQPPLLPTSEVDYLDYAHWQNSEKIKQKQQAGVDFWRTALAGIPNQTALPFDHEQARGKSQGDVVSFNIPAHLSKSLKELAQQQQCSLFMLLIGTYSTLLHQQTRSQDIVIGTDVANRDHLQTENMLGFFVNLMPLRMQPKPTLRFSDHLQNVRQHCLNCFDHQSVPFEQIVETVNPQRTAGVHPLVQALFVLQNTPELRNRPNDMQVTHVDLEQQHSKFDMALFANETDEEIAFNWVFNRCLFDKTTIEQLSKQFVQLLEQIAADPQKPLNTYGVKQQKKAKLGKLGKLKKLKTKRVESSITVAPLEPGKPFPLLVQCHDNALDALAWARKNQQQILSWLEVHGGIVFRGFNLPTAFEFEQFAMAMYPGLYAGYGDLPKNDLGSKIYKSTPYPKDQMIMFHNESSHQHRWPRRQWFYCSQPATVGGATPIVDCREMYRRLPELMRTKLEQKQLRYIRNFSDLDVSWQHFFKTQSRAKVEELCLENNIECTWYGKDNLKISQLSPAVITHPVTGEKSFFNQIQLHHAAFLESEVRQHLLETGGEDMLPRNVCYGDMTPIEPEVITTISELYEACAVRFDWQKSDVVMLDNMLAAHARDPFEGERKIAGAMGDIYQPGETPGLPVSVSATALTTKAEQTS